MSASTCLLGRPAAVEQRPVAKVAPRKLLETAPVDIAPTDPLLAYFQQATGAVEIDRLDLDPPAPRRSAGSGRAPGGSG